MKTTKHTMRHILYVCLLFCFQLSVINSATAQVVPDSYRQQKQQEYTHFADSILTDFARYLEHLWTEYQLFEGEMSPRDTKPVEQPVIDTVDPNDDSLKTDRQIPYGEYSVQKDEKREHRVPDVQNIQRQNYEVTFYGRRLNIMLPKGIADLRLGGTRERHVARFWKRLAEQHAEQSVASLDQQRRNLYLGDWGLFDLVRHLATCVYPERPNEQTILSVFLLNVMHFDVRMGRVGDQLVVLANTGNLLYNIPYIEVGDTRYYAFGPQPLKGKIRTYDQQPTGADSPMDMHLDYSPRLGDNPSTRTFTGELSGKTVSLQVNQSLMEFYARYPQTELSVYASAAMGETFAAALEQQFAPIVGQQNHVKALNSLLLFMQQGFAYQADRKQFGHEKNFFCEENFYYPANDCEDRAVLFARMVQLLLGLDAVLLVYDNHVAAAVHIPGQKVRGHHLDIDGRRFMVCDPTCIGAKVGDLSRKYRHKKANIILTK